MSPNAFSRRDHRYYEKRRVCYRLAHKRCDFCRTPLKLHEGQLHHLVRLYHRPDWDYSPFELAFLCPECHHKAHKPPTPNPQQMPLFAPTELDGLLRTPAANDMLWRKRGTESV